jgi:hypothetical protein
VVRIRPPLPHLPFPFFWVLLGGKPIPRRTARKERLSGAACFFTRLFPRAFLLGGGRESPDP